MVFPAGTVARVLTVPALFDPFNRKPTMLTGASLLLYSQPNSSFAPPCPRNRSSLITIAPPTLGCRPVPDSEAVVDPPWLLVTVSVAVATPAVVGVKVTGTSVDAPAANVVVAGDPAENCEEPLTENGGLSVTAKLLVFVMVTGSVAVEPTVTTPNERGVGAADSVAETMPTM